MFKYFLISLLIGFISSEIIDYQVCPDSDDSICEIKAVRVDPCKEAKSKKPCKVKSGTNATIEFDYVSHFDADRVVTQAYSATALVDLPLIGMDRDGCKYTQCPTRRGETGVYKNSLYISPAFPLLNFNVKFRIWDQKRDNDGCCIIFKIKIVR